MNRGKYIVTVSGLLLLGAVALGVWLPGPAKPPQAEQHTAAAGDLYTCGMHPWVITTEPGLCPICHMDLTPIDPAKFTGELSIDPVVAQNIGVRTATVTEGPLVRPIRTVGSVEHDQTRIYDVNLRFDGWIEKLHADTEGRHVHEGEPLFDIYSPQVLASQRELLAAKGDADLLNAARERLINFGLTDEQIDGVLETGHVPRTVTIHSPATGHLIVKNAFAGMRVEPATLLFRIADHRTVWMDVVVYEQHLPFMRKGMAATMTFDALPGRTFDGRVSLVFPHLDPRTRQLTVRVVAQNPDLLLKPGMFADVMLQGDLGDRGVLVPREAVIDTGTRRVAFVALDEGRFEPREVKLGVEIGDGLVQVQEGLVAGEHVVTSGQFLLDSEARLRESIARMLPVPTGAHQHSSALRDPRPGETLKHYEPTTCLVSGRKLGAMGEPIVKTYGDMQIKFCCASCIGRFEKDPEKYLAQLKPEVSP